MLKKLTWGALGLVLLAGAGCRPTPSSLSPASPVKDGVAVAPHPPNSEFESRLRFSEGYSETLSSDFYRRPERAGWPEWKRRAAWYEPLLHEAAARHGVDARWLWIIAYLESRFRPEAVSPRRARGLMQFTPATAKSYGLADPHQPAAAIDAAARLLRRLALRFGGRFDLVLAAYNAGEGAVDAYLQGGTLRLSNGRVINPQGRHTGGLPPYPETINYVRQGMALAQFLTTEIPAPVVK